MYLSYKRKKLVYDIRAWFKRRINIIRFWTITKLVGNMPIAANLKISNYDSERNFNHKLLDIRPHMFYNNRVYDMAELLQQEVYTGNTGKVVRRNNMFVLKS